MLSADNVMYIDRKKINIVVIAAGLTLLALGFRLAFLWLFPIVQRDGILYLEMITVWNDTGSYQEILKHFQNYSWIPPFPLYLMKFFMPLGVSAECSARIFSIICGSLVPIIGYGIAWTLTKRQYIAIAAGLLFAVHPVFIEFSTQPLRDGFYIFWAGLTLFCVSRGMVYARWVDWCVAGVSAAASFLTRYEALEFFPLILVFLVSAPVFHQYSWKKALLHGVLFLGVTLLMFFLLHCLMGTWSYFLDSYWDFYNMKWLGFKLLWKF